MSIIKNKKAGIYIHIPFCTGKCLYCDFPSYPLSGFSWHYIDRYIKSLVKEIRLYSSKNPLSSCLSISSVFIGGGTPSALPAEYLLLVLDAVSSYFTLSKECEITIEVNPETVSEKFISSMKRGGVTRISLGVQTVQDSLLSMLGRSHNSYKIYRAAEAIVKAGLKNFSADIMYGIPYQTIKDWEETLKKITSLHPSHISAYCLTIEGNASFYNMYKSKQLQLPKEETVVDMVNLLKNFLSSEGYGQYEISNFSMPGFECRHNINYWLKGDYLGFGASAYSSINEKRSWNEKRVDIYIALCEKGRSPKKGCEKLTKKQSMLETIMLNMRMRQGLNIANFNSIFSCDFLDTFKDEITSLIDDGLVEIIDNHIKPTQKGLLFHTDLAVRFFY